MTVFCWGEPVSFVFSEAVKCFSGTLWHHQTGQRPGQSAAGGCGARPPPHNTGVVSDCGPWDGGSSWIIGITWNLFWTQEMTLPFVIQNLMIFSGSEPRKVYHWKPWWFRQLGPVGLCIMQALSTWLWTWTKQKWGPTWLMVLWCPLEKRVSLNYVCVPALPGSDLCMCPTGRTVWSSFWRTCLMGIRWRAAWSVGCRCCLPCWSQGVLGELTLNILEKQNRVPLCHRIWISRRSQKMLYF